MKELSLHGADSLAGKTELRATVGLNLCAVEKKRAEHSERKWNLGIRRTWPADFLSMALNQCLPAPMCYERQGTVFKSKIMGTGAAFPVGSQVLSLRG